jgi:hypothetical protein
VFGLWKGSKTAERWLVGYCQSSAEQRYVSLDISKEEDYGNFEVAARVMPDIGRRRWMRKHE